MVWEIVKTALSGIAVLISLAAFIVALKALHAPYRSYLSLDETYASSVASRTYLIIKNRGKDDALDVGVHYFIRRMDECVHPFPLQKKCVDLGDILEGESKNFETDPIYYYKFPILIKWKTRTGHLQRSLWIPKGEDGRLTRIANRRYVFYSIKYSVLKLLRPLECYI